MSNYEECWKRLFWNFANKGEQENIHLMIDIENECIGPMDEELRAEDFGAEVHLYNDGEYESGMGFITSNKEKYREKIISIIQDSHRMEDYEPTEKDIKEGYPTGGDYSTWRKREQEWLSKKSDAQLKKMLKRAYPYGLEKKIDLDEKVLNIAGNRKGLDIMLEAEEFGAETLSFKEKVEKMFDFSHPQNAIGVKKYSQREAGQRGRRREYEQMGVLPKAKGYRVETPKWFKLAQMGVVAGLAGLISYSGFKGKE